MIIKKYAKCTLVAAAVLAANVSAFAQVKLNGIADELKWEDFVAAVNTPSKASTIVPETTELSNAKTAYNAAVDAQTKAAADVDAKETAVADAQTAYDNGVNTLNNLIAKREAIKPQTERTNYAWFTENKDSCESFYQAYEYNKPGDEPKIWYYYASGRTGKKLYVSFLPSGDYAINGNKLQAVNQSEFYAKVVEATDVTFTTVEVYLGTENTNGNLIVTVSS